MAAAALLGGANVFAAPQAPLQLVQPAAAPAKSHHAAKPAKASGTKPAKAHAAKPVATKPVAAKRAAAAKPVRAALHAVPLPRKRPHAAIPAAASAYADVDAGRRAASDPMLKAPLPPVFRPASPAVSGGLPPAVSGPTPPVLSHPTPPPVFRPLPVAAAPSTPPADLAALKAVLEAVQKRKTTAADAAAQAIHDPLAHKLAEWMILRSNSDLSFQRYDAFIEANPDWPLAALFRRRAEAALWDDQINDLRVISFFAKSKPTTAKGRYVLARALLNQGDRAGAAALVRHAWRYQDCSADVESRVLQAFAGLLTRADDKARMDQRFYDNDTEAGLRMAKRLGGDQLAIAHAWSAVIHGARNATTLLDAVPAAARHDPGYIFARAHWLRRENKIDEAARLMLEAPREAEAAVDPDRWWQDRRILVRDLLDRRDPKTAYRIAAEAVTPNKPFYHADKYFTAGWIALRYLHDAPRAASLFAHVGEGSRNPHFISRAGYWQGRAAEAMGRAAEAQRYYQMAAAQTLTYYGQLARAKLGIADLGLRGPPHVEAPKRPLLARVEIVRAAEMLYALGEHDMLATIFAEVGESSTDVAAMTGLGELAAKHADGRSMVLLGEFAYARGLPLDYFAYPTVGLPNYRPVAELDQPVAYAIARQESRFNQKVVSPAQAMGLMQVTPDAAKDTAHRYKVAYNRARLLTDPVYNMQMGTAELANLLSGYGGSYILTFAGYNAGRGRVKQWIEAYGDPRDPSVDPVDWVERIPFSETRNYVMRVMENLQVYRARFNGSGRLRIEADIRRGGDN